MPSALDNPNSGGAACVGGLDLGGEHVDARRAADQPRHLVGRHAEHEQQQGGREQRRAQQRQRDLRHHLPVARAGHQRRLFQADIEHPQRRPEREIGEREVVTGQRPDHALHGVDAERRLGEAEPVLHQRIDPADIRAEHEDPGHRRRAGRGSRTTAAPANGTAGRAARRCAPPRTPPLRPSAASARRCRRRRSANCRTAGRCASSE